MTETQRKLTYWSIIGFGIFLIVFLIVFNGAYWGTTPPKTDLDTCYVVMSTLFPFFGACNCFSCAYYFKTFTPQDGINQLDRQLNSGLISIDDYQKGVEAIYRQANIKKKLKADMITKKAKVEADIEKEKEKTRQDIIKNLKKVKENERQE